jgi:hypothetical protein
MESKIELIDFLKCSAEGSVRAASSRSKSDEYSVQWLKVSVSYQRACPMSLTSMKSA